MKLIAKAQHVDKNTAISYAGYRFPPELISYAVWLYFRFPLSLRMVEEMLAARGIEITYEGVHLFLLPNPQRWKRALARGGSAKCLILMSFLLGVLLSASPRQLNIDFTR